MHGQMGMHTVAALARLQVGCAHHSGVVAAMCTHKWTAGAYINGPLAPAHLCKWVTGAGVQVGCMHLWWRGGSHAHGPLMPTMLVAVLAPPRMCKWDL